MKSLVCVAPNGDLEVWEINKAAKAFAWPSWTITCGYSFNCYVVWFVYGINERPEFWGREVLGKL